MSQQPAEEWDDMNEQSNRERLIAACDMAEPIPTDVLDRIRRRVQLANASRSHLPVAFEQSI